MNWFSVLLLLMVPLLGWVQAVAVEPRANAAAWPVALRAGPAAAGGVALAELGLAQAGDVQGFNLLLEFAPSGIVSGVAEEFVRNGAYFPQVSLGQHGLNVARDAGPGRIRIIGLAPNAASGPVSIGVQRLRIAAGAPAGATQVITLSGELNVGGVVTTIEPVTAVVTVVELDENLYLPLIQRH